MVSISDKRGGSRIVILLVLTFLFIVIIGLMYVSGLDMPTSGQHVAPVIQPGNGIGGCPSGVSSLDGCDSDTEATHD